MKNVFLASVIIIFFIGCGSNSNDTPTVTTIIDENIPLLKTGQTNCLDYDTNNSTICTQSHKGQDGYYQMGLDRNYTRDNDKKIVIDNTTGLIWQDDNDAKTVTKTWEAAKRHCQNLILGGYTNWRLPTIKELQTLLDFSKYAPSIDGEFQNVNTLYSYWSFTNNVGDTFYAWFVNFYYGNSRNYRKTNNGYVRCVSFGQ